MEIKVIYDKDDKQILKAKLAKYFYSKSENKEYIQESNSLFKNINKLVKANRIDFDEESDLSADIVDAEEFVFEVLSSCPNIFWIDTSKQSEEKEQKEKKH